MMQLYTDGSVHPPSRVGYGAYLAITAETPNPEIQLKRFDDVGSSQLEIETLIWALTILQPASVIIYTDSQTIIGLSERRARFEERNYRTRKNEPIRHAELYRAFFRLCDQINCTFVKLKGHSISQQKTAEDLHFTKVDRASRQALRKHVG